MSKFFKIGCGAFIAFFAIAYAFYYYETGGSKPTQSIKFLNTSDATKSVTFEKIEADGKLEKAYYVNSKAKPGDFVIEMVPEGHYKIKVWDAEDNLVKEIDYTVKLPNPEKSNYELVRFDMAQDKAFVIVNMNSLYKGGAIAEHMSQAMGTKRSGLTIAKAYNGQKPFMLDENITIRKVIDFEDDFPSSIKYGVTVYGIFAVPLSLKGEDAENYLMNEVAKRFK